MCSASYGKLHKGISFVLVDMKTLGNHCAANPPPGWQLRSKRDLVRQCARAVANRIGEEDEDGTYAKLILGHERTNLAGIGAARAALKRLKERAPPT